METSASFEARSAPSSYPTAAGNGGYRQGDPKSADRLFPYSAGRFGAIRDEGEMVKPVSVAFVLFALATAARAEPLPVPMPDRAAGPTRMASRIQAASACLPRAPRTRFLSATAAARTGGLPAVRSVSEAGGDSM